VTQEKRSFLEERKRQIDAYAKEVPHYESYARVLMRVLKDACRSPFPMPS
jgi:hypothetical protein